MKRFKTSPLHSEHVIRKNTFFSLIISGIGTLYPILVFLYVARILHPVGIGRVQFASSYAAYFSLFTGLGMSTYALRAVAARRHSPEKLSRLTAELMLLRLISGLLAFGVFILSTQLFQQRIVYNGTVLMIYGYSILMAIPECSWLYMGMEDYSPMVWISTGARLSGIAAILLLVHSLRDINTYAWISILIPFVTSLAELILAEKKWHLRLLAEFKKIITSGRCFRTCLKHLRPLSLFLLMSCAVTVYNHTDTVMLNLMTANKNTVGLYTCAAKLKGLLPMLTGALWAAALPRSSELWKKQDISGFRELAGKSFHVVTMITIPLTLFFCLFAEPWIHIIGGKEYLDAAQTMRFLLPAVIPIGFSNILGGQILIPMGQERKLLYAELIGAISNILLNWLLIPVWSAPGAAIATTISEILVAIFTACSVKKQISIRIIQPTNLCRSILGCLIAGLVSFGITALIPASKFSDLLKVILSFVVFGCVFTLIMLVYRDTLFRDLFSYARKAYRKIVPASIRMPLGKIIIRVREIRYRLEEKAFSHKCKFFCPCCRTRLMTFVSKEYKEFPNHFNVNRYFQTNNNVICPVCESLPRHRILAVWCEEHIDLLHNARILYFAPEDCMMRWMKHRQITCTTADLYQKASMKLDIQETGQPDSSWDIVICNHVLEHVEDFRKALEELYRILKPGGHLICSFPIDPNIEIVDEADPSKNLTQEECLQRFGQADHLRVFGMKADLLLEEPGFSIEKISGDTCPPEILPVVGPADYDINYLFDCCK